MLFLTGLVIVSFAYTNFVIDDALIGRFLVLNVMLILVVPFLPAPGADKIVRTPIIGFYFLFFCFNVLSTAWPNNILNDSKNPSAAFIAQAVERTLKQKNRK